MIPPRHERPPERNHDPSAPFDYQHSRYEAILVVVGVFVFVAMCSMIILAIAVIANEAGLL